ncbi:hypothetical protein FRC16_011327 [Serendipita sp. 398]|nr:hypothetical protein FRC16_011327 [Serendipita sp. 398]
MSHRVAILTISDTAFRDQALDLSGPKIEEKLVSGGDFTIKDREIVQDNKDAISSSVLSWTQREDIDLIISTGGTGFSPNDVTPEAISPLLERQASGLVHALLSASPKAVLSRPVAGTRNQTLIITLPGSPKAVTEGVEALLAGGVLEHALALLKGANSRKLHSHDEKEQDVLSSSHSQETQKDNSHGHHHHHHHHHHRHHSAPKPRTQVFDGSIPSVSQRARKSPYPLISLQEAHHRMHSSISPLNQVRVKVDTQLRGHVLSEAVVGEYDIPKLNSSNVDGYAIKSTQAPGVYRVLSSGQHPLSEPVPEGSIYRINTGAPLPVRTDAVIMVEDTQLERASTMDGGGHQSEELDVRTLAQVELGENVRQAGSDVKKGDLAFEKGSIIGSTGGDIGALAFVGKSEVNVYRKPVVAIMSTGNELLDLEEDGTSTHSQWKSWDCNRPILKGALESLGYKVIDMGIVRDTLDDHETVIMTALERADIVVTTGGSSMGTTDFMKPVIERLKGEVIFGRVKVKPGKPTILAKLPCRDSGSGSRPLFCLPGNPASALVTFYLFVLPALKILGGYPQKACHLQPVRVKLAENMLLDPRPEFHRVIVRPSETSGELVAYSTGGQRSSRATSLGGANALVVLPAREEGGPDRKLADDFAEALLIDF